MSIFDRLLGREKRPIYQEWDEDFRSTRIGADAVPGRTFEAAGWNEGRGFDGERRGEVEPRGMTRTMIEPVRRDRAVVGPPPAVSRPMMPEPDTGIPSGATIQHVVTSTRPDGGTERTTARWTHGREVAGNGEPEVTRSRGERGGGEEFRAGPMPVRRPLTVGERFLAQRFGMGGNRKFAEFAMGVLDRPRRELAQDLEVWSADRQREADILKEREQAKGLRSQGAEAAEIGAGRPLMNERGDVVTRGEGGAVRVDRAPQETKVGAGVVVRPDGTVEWKPESQTDMQVALLQATATASRYFGPVVQKYGMIGTWNGKTYQWRMPPKGAPTIEYVGQDGKPMKITGSGAGGMKMDEIPEWGKGEGAASGPTGGAATSGQAGTAAAPAEKKLVGRYQDKAGKVYSRYSDGSKVYDL